MTEYKFYYGYACERVFAENPRNAVLKFRQNFALTKWEIWYALPKEHTFLCMRDYCLTDDNKVLYYECNIKPVY